jgi:phosphoribosylanthranilate isomerase
LVKIKICGLTNYEDALAAVEAGADFLGFVLYQYSPRYIRPEEAGEIVFNLKFNSNSQLPIPPVVGVFVNSPLESVRYALEYCGMDGVQLHGGEEPDFVQAFRGRAYKALRLQSEAEAESLQSKAEAESLQSKEEVESLQSKEEVESLLEEYASAVNPKEEWPAFLLDTYHPTLHGGTGQVADWRLAAGIAARYRIMLAGGLTPENVAEAIQAVRPWGVDVSSGIELEPGKKDHEKLKAFIAAVRSRTE